MLVVVPSRRAGARLVDPSLIARGDLGSAAAWTGDVMTLRDLVDAASAAHPQPRKRLGRAAASLLASDVIERLEPDARALFGPRLEGPGTARAIHAAVAEIRMAGLSAIDVAGVSEGRRRLRGLAAVLDQWERRLAEGGWWDDADAHRAATLAIESEAWPAGPRRLEIRGLYDVTPLQGRLLVALARRSRSVRVHVPFDPDDEESSRFAFPYLHLWESVADAGLDVELVLSDLDAGARVAFAAGTDRADEIRRLVEWLRKLGESGVPLHEIGVVAAGTGRSHEHLARELDRHGLPWHARRAAPVDETPPLVAALLPFRLLEEGFRRADLIAWTTSPLTTGLEADLLRPVLAAGPAGRARVAQWNRALSAARGPSAARLVHAIGEIELLGREPRPPDAFWESWERILAAAGIDPGEAWEEGQAELRDALESLDRWKGPPQPWRAHRRQILGVFGDRRARVGRPGSGVQVLTPYDARGLSFRHLAVIGLAQGALVARGPSISVLGERERRALGARFGTELFRLPGEASAEAALLLHEWIRSTAAEVRLSWPAREDDGTPLLPALEYERERRARTAPPPETSRPAPLIAWRVDVTPERVAQLQRIEKDRAGFFARKPAERRGTGGRYDGAFDAAAREALSAEIHDGVLARWSPGRLETFRQCPHRFFQQYVLRLAPVEEAPLEAEPLALGSVVHRALEILFDAGVGPEPPPRDRIDAALAAAESAAEPAQRGDPDVWRAQVSRVAAFLDRYLRWIFTGRPPDPFVPQRYEATFGLDPDGAAAVPISTSLGRVLLRGKIDRLDRDPGTNRLRVVDYKYSAAQRHRDAVKADLCGVDKFQLWSYYLGARAWAEKQGWPEPTAVLGEIHCLREAKGKPVLPAPPSPPREDVEAAIAAVVEAAAAGAYDPSPLDTDVCKYCDYKRSCRIATVTIGVVAGPEEDEA